MGEEYDHLLDIEMRTMSALGVAGQLLNILGNGWQVAEGALSLKFYLHLDNILRVLSLNHG